MVIRGIRSGYYRSLEGKCHHCKLASTFNAFYSTVCARIFLIKLLSVSCLNHSQKQTVHHARCYATSVQTTRTPGMDFWTRWRYPKGIGNSKSFNPSISAHLDHIIPAANSPTCTHSRSTSNLSLNLVHLSLLLRLRGLSLPTDDLLNSPQTFLPLI